MALKLKKHLAVRDKQETEVERCENRRPSPPRPPSRHQPQDEGHVVSRLKIDVQVTLKAVKIEIKGLASY